MSEITPTQLDEQLRSVHYRTPAIDQEIAALTRQVLAIPTRRRWYTVPTVLLGIGLTFAGVGTAAAVAGPEIVRALGWVPDNSATAVIPSGVECEFYFRVPTDTSGHGDISEQIAITKTYLRDLDFSTIHADPVTSTTSIDGDTGEIVEQDRTSLEASAFSFAVAEDVWAELDRQGFALVTTFDASWDCGEGSAE